MIVYQFVIWMVFELLPNCNDCKLNNKLHDLTLQKRNRVLCHGAAVFSVSRAANFTGIVLAIKHAALL